MCCNLGVVGCVVRKWSFRIRRLTMNAGEWCELSALHNRECTSAGLPHASACRCRPNSTTTGNGIGYAEPYFLDSVRLMGVVCGHNSSSAYLMSSPCVVPKWSFRVFSAYCRGLRIHKHVSSGFAELGLWETEHVAALNPPHSDVAP